MDKLKNILLKLSTISLLQHLLFWIFSFGILLQIFSSGNDFSLPDYIYCFMFIITLIFPVYLNLKVYIPYLMKRKRYFFYLLSIVFSMPFFIFLNYLTFQYLIDFIFPGFYFISYYDFSDISIFFLVFIVSSSLLKLSKSWFIVTETQKKLVLAEKEMINNELLALKSQINPHFLFNSLNSIYSLSLKKSDLAPGAVIKLGNILRYVIYQGQNMKVSLKDEIKILNEYIDLQRMRLNKDNIKFKYDIEEGQLEISPLIFLPLIENGFKHGVKSEINSSYLNIDLVVKSGVLRFKTENNKGSSATPEDKNLKGIGLKNIQRRLEITYPDKHEFHIFENKDVFICEVKIFYGKENKLPNSR